MRRRFVAALLLGSASAPLVAFGCSLGLDASLIGADGGALVDGSTPPVDGVAPDALIDGAPPKPDPGACAQDSDCKSTSACVKAAHCDPDSKLCVYDVCTSQACQASSCDTQGTTCSVPAAYNFHATSFKVVLGGVGCGSPSRCFAAAYPFVFVGTTNGVIAYQVGDPTNSAPPPVPVTGLPFLPQHIVANGRRVYFIGNVVGSGPSYHLAIAWLDVPGNPFITAFAAKTSFVTYPRDVVSNAFAGTAGGLFLEYGDAAKAFPSVLLSAPIVDSSSIALFPTPGIATNASIVAASGSRFITYRWDGSNTGYNALFSFENGAGTANAQNGGEQQATAMGEVYPQGFFATGAGGSVLWSAPQVIVPDGGPATTISARMTWLVADAKATTFDESAHVDVEPYSNPNNGYGISAAGPMAVMDPKTALVLAASKDNLQQTSVQVASRALTPPALLAGRRYVLPVDVYHSAAAASGGFGYVLVQDDQLNQSATVHVFAPACQ
jgi:hypothetical protein